MCVIILIRAIFTLEKRFYRKISTGPVDMRERCTTCMECFLFSAVHKRESKFFAALKLTSEITGQHLSAHSDEQTYHKKEPSKVLINLSAKISQIFNTISKPNYIAPHVILSSFHLSFFLPRCCLLFFSISRRCSFTFQVSFKVLLLSSSLQQLCVFMRMLKLVERRVVQPELLESNVYLQVLLKFATDTNF